ncbi:CLUMA_CG006640, isoform A [Clunio marinus]|uniref:CLUMA_CG006640, isoform A n=1 Tax=Clunio marinus TaxID=568069 RepID=A0A1J1HYE7_9DIPT|nr:CLUMA_CG006640, isoform A [Clunio marinus]
MNISIRSQDKTRRLDFYYSHICFIFIVLRLKLEEYQQRSCLINLIHQTWIRLFLCESCADNPVIKILRSKCESKQFYDI